jgi:hypothetical protein
MISNLLAARRLAAAPGSRLLSRAVLVQPIEFDRAAGSAPPSRALVGPRRQARRFCPVSGKAGESPRGAVPLVLVTGPGVLGLRLRAPAQGISSSVIAMAQQPAWPPQLSQTPVSGITWLQTGHTPPARPSRTTWPPPLAIHHGSDTGLTGASPHPRVTRRLEV